MELLLWFFILCAEIVDVFLLEGTKFKRLLLSVVKNIAYFCSPMLRSMRWFRHNPSVPIFLSRLRTFRLRLLLFFPMFHNRNYFLVNLKMFVHIENFNCPTFSRHDLHWDVSSCEIKLSAILSSSNSVYETKNQITCRNTNWEIKIIYLSQSIFSSLHDNYSFPAFDRNWNSDWLCLC